MSEVTASELHDEVFSAKDKVNGDALDGLLLALAENKPVDEFLAVLRKSAQAAYYELSGQAEQDDRQAQYEYDDYVASVNYAAMM